MKNILCKLVSVIAITVLLTSCIRIVSIRGNGDLKSFEMSVSSFEKIKSSGSWDIRFHESRDYRVIVTIDSNLEEYVDIYTKNNTLHIEMKNDWGNKTIIFTKYVVDVYCPVLMGVTLSGSEKFEGIDEIVAPLFDVVITGSGKVNGRFNCKNFSTKISGSGNITVSGISNYTDITISGSGNFNGSNFSTKNASINVSGSGKVSICVSDNLNATISGSGKITYCGSPVVNSKISGSGTIKKM